MDDTKPHLLHVTLDDYEHDGVGFTIECPYKGQEQPPCGGWEECDCSEPEEPNYPEPAHTYAGLVGARTYLDPAAEGVEEWKKYWSAQAEYEEKHLHDGLHRTNECWAESMVREGRIEDDWELNGFRGYRIGGPVPVKIINAGDVDDSFLQLCPWTPDA